MTTSESSAGWHPDPWGRFAQRYWDGAAWTEHVAERGEVFEDVIDELAALGHALFRRGRLGIEPRIYTDETRMMKAAESSIRVSSVSIRG